MAVRPLGGVGGRGSGGPRWGGGRGVSTRVTHPHRGGPETAEQLPDVRGYLADAAVWMSFSVFAASDWPSRNDWILDPVSVSDWEPYQVLEGRTR